MSECYTQRFDDAAAFAIAAFRGNTRKSSAVPYITHLFSVCALVGEYGGDEDQMIAALLHDWLEDIPGAKETMLRHRYGDRVTRLVVALSDSSAPEPGSQKTEWLPRKQAYLEHLRHADPEVKLVSCADKLHNCMTIRADHASVGNAVFGRFTGRQDGTLWYYDTVCHALGENWDGPMLRRLRGEVDGLISAARNAP